MRAQRPSSCAQAWVRGSPAPYRLRDAAPAQLRVRGIGAHVGTVVPAARALGVAAGAHLDHFLGLGADLHHPRLRGDEHEAQVVLQSGKRLVAVARWPGSRPRPPAASRCPPCTRSCSSSFCTLARTSRTRLQRLFEHLATAHFGQHAGRVQEHAVALVAAEQAPGFLRGEAQDRREQPQQAVGDVVERALRASGAPGSPYRWCRAGP